MKLRILSIVALVASLPLVESVAAPATAAPPRQLQLSANVSESCTFEPIPAIALGAYDWRKGIDTTVGNELSVICNQGTFYSFTSDHGRNAKNGRDYMSSGFASLAYSLLVTDGSGSFDPTVDQLGREQVEVASGKTDGYGISIDVAANQTVPAGAYDDTVTFSLNY
jgi:spore coat protein U-like protein